MWRFSENLQKFNSFRLEILLISIIILLGVLIKIPDPLYMIQDTDGGHQLAGALQILAGDQPFVDFRSSFGPVTFYASAVAQFLSGHTLIGEVILTSLGYIIGYFLLYSLIYRISRKKTISVFVTIIALLFMPKIYKYYLLLGPVATLLLSWYYVEKKKLLSLFWLSCSIGVMALFRFDFGGYTGVCGLAAVILAHRADLSLTLKRIGLLLVFILITVCPWILWVTINGGLGNYISDTLSGLFNQSEGLSLPLPRYDASAPIFGLNNGTFYAYIYFHLIPTGSLIVLLLRRKSMTYSQKIQVLLSIILAQLTLIQSLHRADYGHLLQSIPICFVLIAWLMSCWRGSKNGEFIQVSLTAIFSFLLAIVIIFNFKFGHKSETNAMALINNLKIYSKNNEALLNHINKVDPQNPYTKVIEYIIKHTSSNDYIFAMPYYTTYYYFTQRHFGGGQMLLAPGYFSEESDQIKMINKMKEQNVSFVIEYPDYRYDNMASRAIENFSPLVSSYVSKEYIYSTKIYPFVIRAKEPLEPYIPVFAKLQNILLPLESSEILYSIDKIEQEPQYVAIEGWAYLKDLEATGSTYLLLQSQDNNKFLFDSSIVQRPDVSSYFNNKQLDKSGFKLFIDTSSIPIGEYQIGLIVTKDADSRLTMTGKTIHLQ